LREGEIECFAERGGWLEPEYARSARRACDAEGDATVEGSEGTVRNGRAV
jgi:hypothetical protein